MICSRSSSPSHPEAAREQREEWLSRDRDLEGRSDVVMRGLGRGCPARSSRRRRSGRMPRVELPLASALLLPETVVQFGTGAFLRGFVDYFIDEANRRGTFGGSIVAVSSTGSSARHAFSTSRRAVHAGHSRARRRQAARRRIASSRPSIGRSQRAMIGTRCLALARDPAIRLVISNTTEVGIALDESDSFDARPPRSFPGSSHASSTSAPRTSTSMSSMASLCFPAS